MSWDEELLPTPAAGAVVKFKDVEQPGVPECWQWWMGLVGGEDILVGSGAG